jgi:hypothetical protein
VLEGDTYVRTHARTRAHTHMNTLARVLTHIHTHTYTSAGLGVKGDTHTHTHRCWCRVSSTGLCGPCFPPDFVARFRSSAGSSHMTRQLFGFRVQGLGFRPSV